MIQPSKPFLNQRVLVTGASSGIGFAVAQALALAGAHIHAVARHWKQVPPTWHTHCADLSVESDVKRLAPYDPMINLHVGLNREKWNPTDPDQTLSLEELIIGYTRDAAYAEFKENEKGQIKEGYLADVVLFSHDLFALDPKEILTAKPTMTIVDGKIVFEA